MVDTGDGLQQANRQQAQQHHQTETDVDRPECEPERASFPFAVIAQPAQAKQHQPDAEHSVHAEQRGMPVHRRRVQPLHVVQRDGWVDEEPEQPGADEIPEADGHKKDDRPPVR